MVSKIYFPSQRDPPQVNAPDLSQPKNAAALQSKGAGQEGILNIDTGRTALNRVSRAYWLTQKGKAEKIKLIARFLVQKRKEYELLKSEFDLLQKEKYKKNMLAYVHT